MSGTEIVFEVGEDELDGGYSAGALGSGIHTQGDTLDELPAQRQGSGGLLLRRRHMERPRLIRLHYVRDVRRTGQCCGTRRHRPMG